MQKRSNLILLKQMSFLRRQIAQQRDATPTKISLRCLASMSMNQVVYKCATELGGGKLAATVTTLQRFLA